jgi:uridine kinase
MISKEIVNSISMLEKPAVIGISGFGGSGKSTLAKVLASQLKATCIGIDSFFKSKDSSEYQFWDIFDFKRLEEEVLKPYLAGDYKISYGEFNWEENKVLNISTIITNGLLIIEGVGIFRPEIIKYFSYSIWIDCPIDVAIERGKKRDKEEFGINQDDNWDGLWKRNDLQCFDEFSPKRKSDCIINCFN